MCEVRVKILNRTLDEVESVIYRANLSFDLLVHGTQDGRIVCITGDGDLMSTVAKLGISSEPCYV